MNIKQHYEAFFDPNEMGLIEKDYMYIEWAESLLEDYKAEKAKAEPTHQQLLVFEEQARNEIIEKWKEIEIIKPRSKKDGFTKPNFISHIFRNGFGSAINFLFEHRKKNDKEFAEAIKLSDTEIQDMIDEALEKNKPKNK
ncbi:hypothetical protein V9L05_18045 [Bernardetia sp. Wsw4-3y2]|uniref:hypothetical protein n=1 Tax=Bernardetia sp. Wsw4-3y2 TaxID=3127471 RepID=UPI0030D3AA39